MLHFIPIITINTIRFGYTGIFSDLNTLFIKIKYLIKYILLILSVLNSNGSKLPQNCHSTKYNDL